MIDWLIDWLIDRLISWLPDRIRESLITVVMDGHADVMDNGSNLRHLVSSLPNYFRYIRFAVLKPLVDDPDFDPRQDSESTDKI